MIFYPSHRNDHAYFECKKEDFLALESSLKKIIERSTGLASRDVLFQEGTFRAEFYNERNQKYPYVQFSEADLGTFDPRLSGVHGGQIIIGGQDVHSMSTYAQDEKAREIIIAGLRALLEERSAMMPTQPNL